VEITVRTDSPRWHVAGQPVHDAEKAAQDHIRELLPDVEPYQGWTNFEFNGSPLRRGQIREVDLAVLTPRRLFLIEIKSFHGRLVGSRRRWTHTARSGVVTDAENPYFLTNRKAKELRSRLNHVVKRLGIPVKVPFVQPAVFLSEPDLVIDLDEEERIGVYGPGGTGVPNVATLLMPTGNSTPAQLNVQNGQFNTFAAALPGLFAELGITSASTHRPGRTHNPEPTARPTKKQYHPWRKPVTPTTVHPYARKAVGGALPTPPMPNTPSAPRARTQPASSACADPWVSRPGERIPGGLTVHKVLGPVNPPDDTPRTVLVSRPDGDPYILRVAVSELGAERITLEAAALRRLPGNQTPKVCAGPHQRYGRVVLEVGYVDGPTLRDRLRRGPLAQETLHVWGRDLLSILETLEAAGVQHRNVTPDTVVLRQTGGPVEPVLVGFSQSSLPFDQDAGDPAYRDPVRGRYHDQAAERYAFALTLRAMAIDRSPDADRSKHGLGHFPALVDEELTAFFGAALSTRRSTRFPSATRMREAWDAVFTKSSRPATTTPPSAIRVIPTQVPSHSRIDPAPRHAR
jgi:hypothetical protein